MDTIKMGRAQFEILGEELKKLEAELARDMNELLHPNGRDAAWERINALCEVSPLTLGEGPIARGPIFWKNRRY